MHQFSLDLEDRPPIASYGHHRVERRNHQLFYKRERAMLGTVLLVILILLLIGALPRWGYSTGWGYYPSGGVGLVLLIIIILLLLGYI
jgi:hypothetical protein